MLQLAQPFAAVPHPEPGQTPPGGDPGPRLLPEVMAPRVTGSIENLDLTAGAERLSQLSGVTIAVPSPPKEAAAGSADSTEPVLDYSRRARLTWKDTPTANALRDFCRAYGCSLARNYRGTLAVAPGVLPAGPVVQADGYAVELNRVSYSDYRSTGEAPEDLTVRRLLTLVVGIRAETGDTLAVAGIENLRALDQDGRDVLDQTPDSALPSPGGRTLPGPFPDQRLQTVSFEWPYPRPYRLKLIEGDLVLYRSIRRSAPEVKLPHDDEPQAVATLGEGQVQFSQVRNQVGTFSAMLHVTQPANVEFAALGGPTPLGLVLEDGSRVSASAYMNSWGFNDGWLTGYVSLSATGLKSRPVQLVWPLATRSETTRRVHFRFENYPAILGPPPARAAAPPARPKPGPRPAAPRKPK